MSSVGKPQRVKLTTGRVKGLEIPEGKGRLYTYDSEVPGLVVCVTARGARSWYLYKRTQGRPVRHCLGRWPAVSVDQARKLALARLGEIAQGKDPRTERIRRQPDRTLGELFDRYLAEHSKVHKKQWREDEWGFRCHLGHWRGRGVRSLTVDEVRAWHAQTGEKSGIYAANAVLKLLQRVLAYAKVTPNPCKEVKRFRERSRDRFLRPEELPRFLESVRAERSERVRDVVLLCLWTGSRKGKVLAMRWEEIDWTQKTWTIPESKNGDPVTIPLVPEAMEVLEERKRRAKGSPWVFPSYGKEGYFHCIKKGWDRICKRAGIVNLRPHDLRRSVGSWMAAGNTSSIIVGKALGHRSPAATAIYTRLDLGPVREALEKATAAMRAAAEKKI